MKALRTETVPQTYGTIIIRLHVLQLHRHRIGQLQFCGHAAPHLGWCPERIQSLVIIVHPRNLCHHGLHCRISCTPGCLIKSVYHKENKCDETARISCLLPVNRICLSALSAEMHSFHQMIHAWQAGQQKQNIFQEMMAVITIFPSERSLSLPSKCIK